MKFAMPIVPPGRQTRASSSATVRLVGREDRAERGRHDVELAGGERERLRVRLDPLELDAVRGGLAPAGGEVLGREVARDDVRAGGGGPDGDVARPGGDVEHALPGADPAGLDEDRADLPDVVSAKR